jgi:[protein-PII] uridylyltransferase
MKFADKAKMSEDLCRISSELLEAGHDGFFIVKRLTEKVDSLLISEYGSALNSSTQSIALVAVGGYGRQEIAPYSDIDIMLLARKRDIASKEAAETFLYRLWDMGLNISHSFRTLSECVDASVHDIKTRTALIEARFLAGDASLFDEFKRDIYQKLLFKNKGDFIKETLREIERRHKSYGDSVYLLEPNIKEGRGGTRDIHSVSWLLKTALKINSIEGLVSILPRKDYEHFIKAYEFILKARVCLHMASKRRNDILSFEFQEPAARMLGFKDTKRFFASEILMRLYYKKAKDIMGVLRGVTRMSGGYAGVPFQRVAKRLSDDFYLSQNEIITVNKNVFKSADKIFLAFALCSAAGRKFSHNVREVIRSRFLFINKKTRSSPKAAIHFMEMLRGSAVYEALREMHDTGILDRFIPEFGSLRNLVIYEPYHRYTADEHTLIAIRNLEMLKSTKHVRLHYLSDILSKVKRESLFLAILLHDIGKGAVGRDGKKHDTRHEDEGYRMLKGILERFNLTAEERHEIEFLVRNHILLAKLSLTRDAESPETIAQLAEAVESEEKLNALYLMTYADMTAVNPDFWTEWKAYVLHDIYTKTLDHLRGVKKEDRGLPEFIRPFASDMPERYLISNTAERINADYGLILRMREEGIAISIEEKSDNTAEITIAATDMPGLFSRIVGALGMRGLNIIRARLYTGKTGVVVDRFSVSNWKELWWHGIEEEIKEDIRKAVLQKETMGEAAFCPPPAASCPLPVLRRFGSFVEIDNETSVDYSILELFCPDRLGLLYDISLQFCGNDIEIISAVINTEDMIAQDVFYLQYRGAKLDADKAVRVLMGAWSVIEE